ncbi:CPBP family intramembrane metalloprotease [Bifidobacterium felsineum]|uniref:CPBP family intramembrane metalloprotease domain-containing protein n=2 Tax=Bifidobacterium felsineum TaxID=2045440 RepID=A0A2M9HLU4_9BIFI|nr:CPBP family intramembrane metalloprotease [Bifidobacterium felsineum]PJM77785.1 CPBP family intramembrane metalloprotease domain-containing protein [Bifidobacterium felsineum]
MPQPDESQQQSTPPLPQHNLQQPQQSGTPQQPQLQQPEPQPQRNWWFVAHRRFALIGAALTVMMVFWLGLNFLATGALHQFFGANAPAWAFLLASSGPLYVVAMPLSMLIFRLVPAIKTRQYSMKSNEFIQLLIMCVPVMYAGSFIGNILSAVMTDGQATNRLTGLMAENDWWMNALFIGILAPIFEEWICRKEIISRTRRYGEKTAIVFSSLAFALFHMNLFQFFYAFGLGLILGYVYTRTSKLRYTIAIHMLINLNGSVLAPMLLRLVDPKLLSGQMSQSEIMRMTESGNSVGLEIFGFYSMAMFALIIAGVVLLVRWFKQRRWEFYPAPEELPAGLKVRTAYANPGVIVYILLTVGLTVWMLFV